eukprot:1783321-Amphidinium_carterae.1
MSGEDQLPAKGCWQRTGLALQFKCAKKVQNQTRKRVPYFDPFYHFAVLGIRKNGSFSLDLQQLVVEVHSPYAHASHL